MEFKVLENPISTTLEIINTYEQAVNDRCALYAGVGRNNRYGYDGKRTYPLTSQNAIEYDGRLFATTVHYESLPNSTDSPDETGNIVAPINAVEMPYIEQTVADEGITEVTDAATLTPTPAADTQVIDNRIVSLEAENTELKKANDDLKNQLLQCQTLANKYLENRDIIDYIDTKTDEFKQPIIEQLKSLQSRLDRIKAVINE